MSEEKARYGRMPKTYAVSQDTSDMLDVIAASTTWAKCWSAR